MPTKDKKRIFIDVRAHWRIVDRMKYFQRVRRAAILCEDDERAELVQCKT